MSHNVEMKVTAGKLHVVIDLGGKAYVSASGKSHILASTQGNITVSGARVPPGLKIGVNAYVPKTT